MSIGRTATSISPMAKAPAAIRRVAVMDKTGKFLRQWKPEGMETVHCLTMGNDGLVYVCDRNARIQVYDKMGCAQAHDPGAVDAGDAEGARRGQFGGASVAIDFSPDQKLIYVINQNSAPIEVIERDSGKKLSAASAAPGTFPASSTSRTASRWTQGEHLPRREPRPAGPEVHDRNPVVANMNPAERPLYNWTQGIYALNAFSLLTGILGAATVIGAFLTGWPWIIAVILNYVKRRDVRETWLDSHFRWQIRTFWYGLLWVSMCGAFGFILTFGVGILIACGLPLAIVSIWFVYRVAQAGSRCAKADRLTCNALRYDQRPRVLRVVFEERFLFSSSSLGRLHLAVDVGHARDERVLARAWRRSTCR